MIKGTHISELHKQQISAATKGRKFTDQHRAKISAALKGIVRRPESILKGAAARKGKKMGEENVSKRPEVRAKISAALKGRKKSPEQIQKMSDQRKGKPSGRKGEKRKPWPLSKTRCQRSRYYVKILAKHLRPNKKVKPPRSEESKEAQRQKMIGRKVHSEEWKQHLREKLKGNTYNLGKKASPESIEKKRQKLIGRKYPGRTNTPEHNKKIGDSKRGKKRAEFSEEWKQKISKAHTGLRVGPKSTNWKVGVTDLRHLIRCSGLYQKWRSDCFKRDDFTCNECGQRGCKLQVHHHPKSFKEIFHQYGFKKLEDTYSCDELWDISNGVTLCISCHAKTDSWGRPYNDKKQ